MPIAWYIAPYKRRLLDTDRPVRYCAMDDFTIVIGADDGNWSESEVLGDVAIVKVRASAATLTIIAGAVDFQRIPNHFNLDDTLGDLTAGQRNAIRNRLNAMGYTLSEISAVIPATGNWASITLGQLLRFAATRRLKPRYDALTDSIICDGPIQPVRPIDDVDRIVV